MSCRLLYCVCCTQYSGLFLFGYDYYIGWPLGNTVPAIYMFVMVTGIVYHCDCR